MDLIAWCGSLIARLEHRLFEPTSAGASRALVVLRYPFALLRDLAQGHLTLRAMSLVYTTLLSIVPLIALSFSVLKGLGYHRYLEPLLYQFLQPLGDRATEITARVMEFVENVQSGVLGSLGLAFLLYTVISMIQKVEESFNFVWRVEQPRTIGRRFSEYLSVMVVGPVIMVAAMGLLATVGSNGMVQLLSHTQILGVAIAQIGRLTPYALVAGVFTFMYAFIPNTKVGLRAAAIGGVVAGVLWSASGELFAAIVVHSSRTMAIYAGFAILIVGLMWLYLSWLILLLGVQLAFYVQHPLFLRPGQGEIRLTPGLRERLALSLMYLVGKDFQTAGPRWTLQRLADALDVPGTALGPVVACLERRGLLVATEEEWLLPGRDLAGIALDEILDAVRNDSDGPRNAAGRIIEPAEAVAREVEAAIKSSMNGRTLKDLVD
ncbi:MAG: YihY/virulence factor BrkB family protein [Steroidobacteraceae bacterium]